MPAKKQRKTPLTRDRLCERAMAIIDREGLEALSMRRLARAVGVEAASLYHHFPDKQALVDGVLLRMRAEMRIPDPVPADILEAMAAIFGEYRRVLARHPNLVPLAGRHVEGDPTGLLALVAQGFAEEDAVELWQSMMAFTIGFSVFSSEYARADVHDLPAGLAGRMAQWHDETCMRTLRMILEGYDRTRRGARA